MARFYISTPIAAAPRFPQLDLPSEVAQHIHVLRLALGDVVDLFDGRGGFHRARLDNIEKKSASVTVLEHIQSECELPYAITLAQGLPEGSKLDWIIEKAVELGVQQIHPLAAQRSVVKLNAERAEKKITHWQGIVIAASEQSGRNRLTEVSAPVKAQSYFAQAYAGSTLLFSPRATESLSSWLARHPAQAVRILIGPEGGFSPEEETDAVRHGAQLLSLGSRVLRTETAGLAAIASINAYWDCPEKS